MKITSVRVIGATAVDFPLLGMTPSDSYICSGIDGLGGGKRNAAIKDGYYQGSTAVAKQLVIRVTVNPDYGVGQTTEDLREVLYGLLSPGDTDLVEVELYEGATLVASLQGVVESIDPVLFAKEPTVQIVVLSLNAYFEAPTDVTIAAPAIGGFDVWTIPYVGNYPTGFYFRIVFTDVLSEFKLAKGTKHMILEHEFVVGDEIVIDTRRGSREIRNMADGAANIVDALTDDSTWLELYPGDNVFSAFADGSPTSFTWVNAAIYRAKYWGV